MDNSFTKRHKQAKPPTAKSGLRPPPAPRRNLSAARPLASRGAKSTADDFLLRRHALVRRIRHGETWRRRLEERGVLTPGIHHVFYVLNTWKGGIGAGGLGKLGRTISRSSFLGEMRRRGFRVPGWDSTYYRGGWGYDGRMNWWAVLGDAHLSVSRLRKMAEMGGTRQARGAGSA